MYYEKVLCPLCPGNPQKEITTPHFRKHLEQVHTIEGMILRYLFWTVHFWGFGPSTFPKNVHFHLDRYSRILTEIESCLVCNICHKRSVEKQVDCFEGLLKDKEEHIQMHPTCKNAEFISVYEKISSKESVQQNLHFHPYRMNCTRSHDMLLGSRR